MNLLSSLVFLPLVSVDLLLPPSPLPVLCLLGEAVSHLVASLSLLSTLLIAVDQYLAIIHALRYHHHITRLRSSLSLGCVWMLSGTIALLAVLLPSKRPHILSSCSKEDADEFQVKVLGVLFSCSIATISFLTPTFLIAVIYLKIYFEAHNSSERSRKCSLKPSDAVNNILTVAVEFDERSRGFQELKPPTETIRRSSTSSCVPKSDKRKQRKTSLPSNNINFKDNLAIIRHRISNASQFIHREEGKTAKIYIISLTSLIFCWSPFFTFSVANQVLPLSLSSWASFLILYLSLCYAAISPFIFAIRKKRVIREVLIMLGISPQANNLPLHQTLPLPKIYQKLSSGGSTRKRKVAIVNRLSQASLPTKVFGDMLSDKTDHESSLCNSFASEEKSTRDSVRK